MPVTIFQRGRPAKHYLAVESFAAVRSLIWLAGIGSMPFRDSTGHPVLLADGGRLPGVARNRGATTA
jgi:hypothetical protein